jgi:hypothetical protein
MDESNGAYAPNQDFTPTQVDGPAQAQFQQQAPMTSPQAAYASQAYPNAIQEQGVINSVGSVQSPTQNVGASWPVDQNSQFTQSPPQQSSLANFDSFAQQDNQKVPISTDAYSFLAEPMDYSSTEASTSPGGKKVLPIVIGLIVILILLGVTGFGAYTTGYQSGESAGKKLAQNSNDLPSDSDKKTETEDELEPEEPAVEEPKLTFELTKPTFEEQALTGLLGEQLILSDGLVINVYNVDSKYKPEPSSNGSDIQYVKVDMIVGNADNARSKAIAGSSFKLMDESGSTIDAIDTEAAGLDLVKSVTLSPGMKARLSAVFEVESFGSTSFLAWSQLYQVGGQSRTIAAQILLDDSTTNNKATLR